MSHNLSVVEDYEYYVEKHQRKKERKQRKVQQSGLTLEEIEPLTYTQRQVFESYNAGNNLVLHGCAGTGKTFLSTYLGVRDVLEKVDGKRQVIIVRSVVPTRDMGFLPGNMTEKTKVYETPYRDLMSGMFNRGDAYDILKTKGCVDFVTTSFIRGQTWDNAIIIVDEAQNLSFQELHSVITRVGENSRILLCGDGKQDDLTSERFKEQSGLSQFLKILSNMDSFDIVDFQTDDIVRSGLVREYILACESSNINIYN
jgi:phosphate starvation-inducible PhoH-like protein